MGRNNLDVIIGKQKSTYDKGGLGYNPIMKLKFMYCVHKELDIHRLIQHPKNIPSIQRTFLASIAGFSVQRTLLGSIARLNVQMNLPSSKGHS
ncbi:hypothetical protein CR513_03673, partial [Mucuna pruriens]